MLSNISPPLRQVLQLVSATDASCTTHTTTVPNDDTIPQKTEGEEIITCSITPTAIGNRIVVETLVYVSASLIVGICGMLFLNDESDALSTSLSICTGVGHICPLIVKHVHTVTSISEHTFKIRLGPVLAGTLTMNGGAGSRKFGGSMKSIIRCTEIL